MKHQALFLRKIKVKTISVVCCKFSFDALRVRSEVILILKVPEMR